MAKKRTVAVFIDNDYLLRSCNELQYGIQEGDYWTYDKRSVLSYASKFGELKLKRAYGNFMTTGSSKRAEFREMGIEIADGSSTRTRGVPHDLSARLKKRVAFYLLSGALLRAVSEKYAIMSVADWMIYVDTTRRLMFDEGIDTFIYISGDKDFLPLYEELYLLKKRVIVVGFEENTAWRIKEGELFEFVDYREVS